MHHPTRVSRFDTSGPDGSSHTPHVCLRYPWSCLGGPPPPQGRLFKSSSLSRDPPSIPQPPRGTLGGGRRRRSARDSYWDPLGKSPEDFSTTVWGPYRPFFRVYRSPWGLPVSSLDVDGSADESQSGNSGRDRGTGTRHVCPSSGPTQGWKSDPGRTSSGPLDTNPRRPSQDP